MTFVPSTSTAELVGMAPFDRKRFEEGAAASVGPLWDRARARRKEFMFILCMWSSLTFCVLHACALHDFHLRTKPRGEIVSSWTWVWGI